MAETTSVTFRMDAEDKRRADRLFNSLGFNMSTALNMFIKQALRYNGLPFDVSLPDNDDFFYSKANVEHLRHSIAQLEKGQYKVHELIEVGEDEQSMD